MRLRRSAFLAVFLVLLGASAALADTFVESFDDGTLDAKLLPHADAGYSEEIASGKLSLAKTNGSGAGEVMVRTGFAFGGDFTVSVVAARTDLGGGAKLGLRVVFQGGATAEIYLDGSDGIEGIIKKSGTPIFLKGPAQGTTATITPSTRRHADSLLVCYQAKLATADIPQAGCGRSTRRARARRSTRSSRSTRRARRS